MTTANSDKGIADRSMGFGLRALNRLAGSDLLAAVLGTAPTRGGGSRRRGQSGRRAPLITVISHHEPHHERGADNDGRCCVSS